uniref:Kinesin motor domain-containing protein n=1 Tax=Timema poppense TaxID=170557 RepID=A0A7R9DPA3_TIMPO|nr:unnamed protein product [Timema poppensis]
MLATISPASTHMEVTLATLKYACQARAIIITPRVNESNHDRIIRGLSEEVAQLRALREECDTPIGRHEGRGLSEEVAQLRALREECDTPIGRHEGRWVVLLYKRGKHCDRIVDVPYINLVLSVCRAERADLVVDEAVLRHRVSTLLDKLREVGANLQGTQGRLERTERALQEAMVGLERLVEERRSQMELLDRWSKGPLPSQMEMLRAMLKARTGQTHCTIATVRQGDGMRRDVEETGKMRDQHLDYHNISKHPTTSIREWRSLPDLSTPWKHDLLGGNRGSSASEQHNLLEGNRESSVSGHDLLGGNRESSVSGHDLLGGNRGSSVSGHDLLGGNRGSSVSGHDLLERSEDSYVCYEEDEDLLNTTFLYSSSETSSEDISQVQECSSQRQQEAEEAARRLAESGPYLTKEILRSLKSTLRALESRLSPDSNHHTPPTITPNTITIRSILRRTPGKTVRFLTPEPGEATSSSPESYCEATLAHSASPLPNTTPPQLYASRIEDNMPDLVCSPNKGTIPSNTTTEIKVLMPNFVNFQTGTVTSRIDLIFSNNVDVTVPNIDQVKNAGPREDKVPKTRFFNDENIAPNSSSLTSGQTRGRYFQKVESN